MPGARLGFEEREKIAMGIARGEPLCDIASRLSRPTSTVSREVLRCGGRDNYTASKASRETRARARRPKCRKLVENLELGSSCSVCFLTTIGSSCTSSWSWSVPVVESAECSRN